MLAGVQIIGIVFALIMMYLTFVYYQRKNYNLNSMILWFMVWIALLILVSFPETVYGIMQALQIERTADFFVMAGFAFFAVIIFYMYVVLKKTNQKIEMLVRKIALEDDNNKKKAKKKK